MDSEKTSMMARSLRLGTTLLTSLVLLAFAAYGYSGQGNEADYGSGSSQNPEEFSSETEDTMSTEIPEIDRKRVEAERQSAAEALKEYLKDKYGYSESDFTTLSDETELAGRCYDGTDFQVTYPEIRYTGYRIAQVELDGQIFKVKYSPTFNKGFYEFGGLDDMEMSILVADVTRDVGMAVSQLPNQIIVRAGAYLWDNSMLLEGKYDGDDYFAPIPDEGILNIQLVYENDVVNGNDIRNELAPLLSGTSKEIFLDVTYRPVKDVDSADTVPLTHYYWDSKTSV